MKELNLQEIKNTELELLRNIDSICKKIGINYSLTGGTLIGAVRHGGFIPWDDDIDICMQRKEYTQFLNYCNNNKNEVPFSVLSYSTTPSFNKLYTKVVDSKTVIKDSIVKDNEEMGLFVDIFPIDYMADTYNESVKVFNSSRYLRQILLTKQWKRYYRNKEKAIYLEPLRFIIYAISHILPSNYLITKIEKKHNERRTEYSCNLSGAYGIREIAPTEYFESYTKLAFEGYEFSVVSKYHDYLKLIYGDYMKLPPVEKRVSNHSFRAFLKN